jgi:hypothetical protein
MNPGNKPNLYWSFFTSQLITGLTFIVIFSSAGIGIDTIQSEKQQIQDSLKNNHSFGMRARKLPENINLIYEPVFVQKAPGNEATVVRIESGKIKIFFVNRPGKADKLMSVTSHDSGIKWDDKKEEFSLPGEAYYANNLLRDKSGELHCIFHIFGNGENGYNGRHLNLWYCHTENHGERWTTPKKIYDGYVGAIRGFIQLKNNRLLLVFARAVPSRSQKPVPGETDFGIHEIISMYSDDLGETWLSSGNGINIPVESSQVTRYGGVEPCIIELNNGKTWMLIRTNKGHLYESYSDNMGETWLPPKSTNFISSDSPATLLRLSDDRIVMIWSGNQRWDDNRSYANGGREVLHAAISDNEGKSWKGFREVLISPSGHFIIKMDIGTAYPSAVETAEGKVLFVSGQAEERAIVCFDPDWLEQTSAYDNFSNGLAQWTLFGVDSTIRLTTNGPRKSEHALLVRKTDANKKSGSEAVWNFPMTQKGKLVLEITRYKGSKGINLSLTDHFSVSYDSLASVNSVVSFATGNSIAEKETENMKITILWDSLSGKAFITMNNKRPGEIIFQRKSITGLNYLRMGIPGTGPDSAGYCIKSVRLITK